MILIDLEKLLDDFDSIDREKLLKYEVVDAKQTIYGTWLKSNNRYQCSSCKTYFLPNTIGQYCSYCGSLNNEIKEK